MKRFTRAIEILQHDYEERQKRNVRFSKRSYAKLLGLSSGRLVDLLNGKTALTEKAARLLISKLNLSPADQDHFLNLVRTEQFHRVDRRRKIKTAGQVVFLDDSRKLLESALKVLESGDSSMCDFSGAKIPVHPEKMNEVKTLVRKFQFNLAALADESTDGDTYCVSVQLFPASKIQS